nr:putative ribonuclease H-like domain-containing protein [Tanacetum cinerariifolium]
ENDHTCVACKKGKQHRASCKTKPVSSVNQPFHRLHMDLFGPTFVKSLNKKSYCLVVTDDYSSSAQSKKHDDKTKRHAKGKSPVESSTGYRNLSTEFEDFSDNSINKDNAVGTLVPVVRQISTNSTNTFSVAGPSNTVVSPTQGKSSYVDSSQLPDDPNKPELEDITYSDDEDDVGAEADFTNLETSITVSPIP